MSATTRAGLIFGGIGFVVVPLLSLLMFAIPLACLCGTLASGILGGLAGYYALRWSPDQTIGKGILAGTLAGVGPLISGLLFFVILFAVVSRTPDFEVLMRQQIDESLAQQGGNVDRAQVEALMNTIVGGIGPISGGCFGIMNLLTALIGGAIGAAIAPKNPVGPSGPIGPSGPFNGPPPPPPPQPPTSYGPPPMSPQ